MKPFPAHLVPATGRRRIAAACVNFMAAGSLIFVAGALAGDGFFPSEYGMAAHVHLVGLVTVLWLFYLLRRRSVGAAVCLLEVFSHDGTPATIRQCIMRSAAFYMLALIAWFPSGIFPVWVDALRVLAALGWGSALMIAGIVSIFTEFSLSDRLSRTVVLQLNLPEDAKPRIFGIRIT